MKVVKVQKECFKCRTFNKDAQGAYKCAITGRCPGITWDNPTKKAYLIKHTR